ncbi:hypothetical protein EXIGLDRAFT_242934 [Exidia glandulosa HHB12029]|uniref:Uncharacterized protein n=1 Tax=Exidia glandulosa HHB12029 TaxID=1314781 RepID=A0A165Q813_EXIGL|nr:hypothetical protein EXIGLDRAFT_242934 [Exidia glandulosa HHB12029]
MALRAVLAATLLCFASLPTAVHANESPPTIGGKSCKFNLHGLHFDLCKMIANSRTRWRMVESTPPTETIMEYSFMFSKPLAFNESMSKARQCPEGTYICLRKWNRLIGPKDTLRLIEVVPIASSTYIPKDDPGEGEASVLESHDHLNVTISLGDRWTSDKHPPIIIQFHGGMYANRAQSATLAVFCDEEVEGITTTTATGGYEKWGWHLFTSRSKYACPTNGWSSHHHHEAKPNPTIPGKPGEAPDPHERLHDGGTTSKPVMFWIGSMLVPDDQCDSSAAASY